VINLSKINQSEKLRWACFQTTVLFFSPSKRKVVVEEEEEVVVVQMRPFGGPMAT
jgi:hypothetical protein